MIHRPERHVLLFRRPLPRSSAQLNQPPFQLISSAPSANDRQQSFLERSTQFFGVQIHETPGISENFL
ncbi:hypothetical protein WR25_05557 [Diploscapter pachys]|uniref:Uncharacterized protein n=1 Tax=Diploscapter pachys TaxID=2018661 RepID=A0A2A2L691_9BILA|nr:hypothetical protein WR25_05557 [Diploscapter pachys]